jgi:hypothetical protein
MGTSETGVLIAAAAIGAGGAVMAQIVSAVITGHRDTKRFQWEQETKDRELEMQKAERFLNQKQELYSSYGSLIEECMNYTSRHIEPTQGLRPPELPDIRALQKARSNIQLIAPDEVSRPVIMAYACVVGALWSSTSEHLSQQRRQTEADAGVRVWSQAFEAMRADLQGEKRRYFQRTGGEVVSPDPPPARLLPWWRHPIKRIRNRRPQTNT